jgi:hypothetical protein
MQHFVSSYSDLFIFFSDPCELGSNGSTKFYESLLSLIPKWRAPLALILECYIKLKLHYNKRNVIHKACDRNYKKDEKCIFRR